jgi:hypothetical protein
MVVSAGTIATTAVMSEHATDAAIMTLISAIRQAARKRGLHGHQYIEDDKLVVVIDLAKQSADTTKA